MANATETRTPTIAANIDGSTLVLTFADGRELCVTRDGLSHEIREAALMHGLKQKLVDAAAIPRNTETGRSATIDDKYNAVREVFDRLLAGEWNKRREGGEGAVSGGLLFAAMCRVYAATKTPEEVRAYLATKTDEDKAQLRKVGKIAAAIEAVRAERAKPVSEEAAAALLADLED